MRKPDGRAPVGRALALPGPTLATPLQDAHIYCGNWHPDAYFYVKIGIRDVYFHFFGDALTPDIFVLPPCAVTSVCESYHIFSCTLPTIAIVRTMS